MNASGFLSALQLADSFFPSGMYAHSQGLEGMVTRGWVSGPPDVENFLRNQLAWSVIPADGVALLNSHAIALRKVSSWKTAGDSAGVRAAAESDDLDTLAAIDRLLHTMKLPSELAAASRQAGRRILEETSALLPQATGGEYGKDRGRAASLTHAAYRSRVSGGDTPGTGAVALGVAASALNIPGESALFMLCHSHAVGVLGAALRLLPMTHSQSQGILHSLHQSIPGWVEEVRRRPWQDMSAFTPELDIASMLHQNDDLRMFAS